METAKKQSNVHSYPRSQKSDKRAEATALLNQSKKLARDVYKNGMNKMNATEESLIQYSDQMMQKIKERPLISVCIAAGIGYVLSMFHRR